ncbi:MAG: hypothetical protein ACRCUX_05720, partial [Beijerinckiaceae bacterium]
ADVASLKKEFDSMNEAASSVSNFNPAESIRNEIQSSVEGASTPSAGGEPLPDPAIKPPDPAPPVDHSAFADAAPPLDTAPPAPAATAQPASPPPAAKAGKADA